MLDPKKRYTLSQIQNHKWMSMDGGGKKEAAPPPAPAVVGQNAKQGECNEQILRLMQSLGIDQQKTTEVSLKRGLLFQKLSSGGDGWGGGGWFQKFCRRCGGLNSGCFINWVRDFQEIVDSHSHRIVSGVKFFLTQTY